MKFKFNQKGIFRVNLLIPSLLALLFLYSIFYFSCKQAERDNNQGLLLLLLSGRNNQPQSSGFLITIPDGVAR